MGQMSVRDKNVEKKGKGDREQREGKVVDIFSTGLPEGKRSKLDPTADAWSAIAPPPAGYYRLKFFHTKDTFTQDETTRGAKQEYFTANVECKIVEPKEHKDVTVYAKSNTLIKKGLDISTMAGMLVKGGKKLKPEMSDKEVAQMYGKWLQSEPMLWAWCDWFGWSMQDNRTAYPNMDSFPKDDEGKPMHIAEYRTKDKNIEEIKAKLKPITFFTDAEYAAIISEEEEGSEEESEEEGEVEDEDSTDDAEDSEDEEAAEEEGEATETNDEDDEDEEVAKVAAAAKKPVMIKKPVKK